MIELNRASMKNPFLLNLDLNDAVIVFADEQSWITNSAGIPEDTIPVYDS